MKEKRVLQVKEKQVLQVKQALEVPVVPVQVFPVQVFPVQVFPVRVFPVRVFLAAKVRLVICSVTLEVPVVLKASAR